MLIQHHDSSTAAHDSGDRLPASPRAQPASGSADREFVIACILAMGGAVVAWGVVFVGAGVLLGG